MNPLVSPWCEALLISSLVRLDNFSGFRSFLGQPLLAGLLVGLFFGQWQAGLAGGLLIQLAWIDDFKRTGGFHPDIGAAGFVAAAVMSALHGQGYSWAGWAGAYALLWAALAATAGGLATNVVARLNRRILTFLDVAALQADHWTFRRFFGLGILHSIFAGIIVGWIPARLAVSVWPLVVEIPFIKERPDAVFGREAILAFGIISLSRLFVNRSRAMAFAAPLIAVGIYSLIMTVLLEPWP